MSNIEIFIDTWGQSTEDICVELGYDLENSDDLLMVDFLYNNTYKVWLPKHSSFYSDEEQKIADQLRK